MHEAATELWEIVKFLQLDFGRTSPEDRDDHN